MFSGVAVSTLGAVGGAHAADGQAVSAPTASVSTSAGSVDGAAAGFLSGIATVPVGNRFGAQLDWVLGQDGDRGQGGGGGHLFWRDPAAAMVGATAMWSRIGGWNVYRYGVESEAYLGDFTVAPAAGLQRGDANEGSSSSGYVNLALSWYAEHNVKLTGGSTDFSNVRVGYGGAQYQCADDSPWSVFAVGGGGNRSTGFGLVGLRVTFGAGTSSLMERDRHGDPDNIVDFATSISGAVGATAQQLRNQTLPVASSGGSPPPSSCFVAGTPVLMADGSVKAIETVQVGERVVGADGAINTVLNFDRPRLGNRRLFALNGSGFFVTQDHPFLTLGGWKSFDPDGTNRENQDLGTTLLRVGDTLVTAQGPVVLAAAEAIESDPDMTVYNFWLDGNNTYTAHGFVVHTYG